MQLLCLHCGGSCDSSSSPRPEPDRRCLILASRSTPATTATADRIDRRLGQDRELFAIAVNGGCRLARSLDITPGLVLGDLDSLSSSDRKALYQSGCQFAVHPARKDLTDTHLAIGWAVDAGYTHVILVMDSRGRLDHVLGNIAVAQHYAVKGIRFGLIDQQMEGVLVAGPAEIGVTADAWVSLLALAGPVTGITLNGMSFPLVDATLDPGESRGLSNRPDPVPASIRFQSGTLLVLATDSELTSPGGKTADSDTARPGKPHRRRAR